MAASSKKITNTPTVSNSTAKKPVTKKVTAVAPVKKPTTAATQKVAPIPTKRVNVPNTEKPASKPASNTKSAPQKSIKKNTVTSEERHHMISTAAYFRAQQRGFICCCEKADWLSGEAQIDEMLKA
jgi:hypothetical protein